MNKYYVAICTTMRILVSACVHLFRPFGVCCFVLFALYPTPAKRFFSLTFSASQQPNVFIIGFGLFLFAVYAKNICQMKVIELSSALTRNLTMQLMPFGTWIVSLLFYYEIDEKYGENWNDHSFVQLIGFVIVLIGSYLYMRVPKLHNQQIVLSIHPSASTTTTSNEFGHPMFTKGSITGSQSYVPIPYPDEGL